MKPEVLPKEMALGSAGFKIRNLRWYVVGLISLAIIICLVDRQVFSILAPDLQRDIGWSELDYSRMVIAFQLSYAVMMMVSGRITDMIGTKLSYSIAIIWWSIAEAAHAFARTPLGFGIARFFLGVGEAPYFPASMKTISEWFPKKERALATGILNAAVTLGAIVSPVVIPRLNQSYGWQGTFIIMGLAGAIPLAGWIILYRRPELHPWVTSEELRLIREGSEREERKTTTRWAKLLKYRQTYTIAVPKVLIDPVFYFYLYWLPKYLAQEHNIRGTAITPYLSTVWTMTGLGSLAAGYLSSWLIKRGWTVNWARKAAMACCAAVTPFVVIACFTKHPWTAVLLVGLVLAAHQGFSTTIFTLGSDLFPSHTVASVIGIGGFIGSLSAVLFSEMTGRILDKDPRYYLPMFVVSGSVYIIAVFVVHILSPKLTPADLR